MQFLDHPPNLILSSYLSHLSFTAAFLCLYIPLHGTKYIYPTCKSVVCCCMWSDCATSGVVANKAVAYSIPFLSTTDCISRVHCMSECGHFEYRDVRGGREAPKINRAAPARGVPGRELRAPCLEPQCEHLHELDGHSPPPPTTSLNPNNVCGNADTHTPHAFLPNIAASATSASPCASATIWPTASAFELHSGS